MDKDNRTVAERYREAIRLYRKQGESVERKDSVSYQRQVASLIQQFKLIRSIVEELNLFSDNERIEEVNTNYLPFLNINYYLGTLYLNSMTDPKARGAISEVDPVEFRSENLQAAKMCLISYIIQIQQYGLLGKTQSDRVNSVKDTFNPTLAELQPTNMAEKRQEKIENYKLEKQLNSKLEVLDDYYDRNADNEDEDKTEFSRFDEDTIRAIYIDQIRLFALNTFSFMETLIMELHVLSNRPPKEQRNTLKQPEDSRQNNSKDNDYGFTTRLEQLPNHKKAISELVSKQGKILQPFTITSNKQQIKDKVFGTGQVLPSMTVEEYLDYELANGKMMKEEVKDKKNEGSDSDEDDSDAELEKRNWDDWKDENPKGSGNMGGNIG
ncbi:TAP42-like protein [Scheffersomyces xylosifermentans]|uniref:TAP42-like protein n=1 Tax=Scheffersomyces xylosifermentans TaxID=1304137 RepID=UPI00315E0317